MLVPSRNVHIACEPSSITRSLRGLPYPTLAVFVQSCLDTMNLVQPVDVMWHQAVRTKKDRLDWTKPSCIFATQYRLFGDPDPWTVLSDMY